MAQADAVSRLAGELRAKAPDRTQTPEAPAPEADTIPVVVVTYSADGFFVDVTHEPRGVVNHPSLAYALEDCRKALRSDGDRTGLDALDRFKMFIGNVPVTRGSRNLGEGK
jgi:hypothetical protein